MLPRVGEEHVPCRFCLPLVQAAQVDGEAGEDLVIGPTLRQAQLAHGEVHHPIGPHPIGDALAQRHRRLLVAGILHQRAAKFDPMVVLRYE